MILEMMIVSDLLGEFEEKKLWVVLFKVSFFILGKYKNVKMIFKRMGVVNIVYVNLGKGFLSM